jgi:hypothetical protein
VSALIQYVPGETELPFKKHTAMPVDFLLITVQLIGFGSPSPAVFRIPIRSRVEKMKIRSRCIRELNCHKV